VTEPKPEPTTEKQHAVRISFASRDELAGDDVLGTCYAKGKVIEANPSGIVVEFRNPEGGPYKVAVHGPTWHVPTVGVGEDVEVELFRSDAQGLPEGTVAVTVPAYGGFFVAADTIVE